MLGLTARAALMWCDALVILDHASTDDTPDIITDVSREHPGRVWRLWVNGEWDEADHRQMMLDMARRTGATHYATIDADELLTGNLIGRVPLPQPGQQIWLPWVCCWRGLDRYRADASVWASAYAPVLFGDGNWTAGDYQMHRRVPNGVTRVNHGTHAEGGLLHLQFVQWDRLVAKQTLYKLHEVLRYPGRKSIDTINKQYGAAMDETNLGTAPVPDEWWAPYRHLMRHLRLCDAPWQAAEVERLIDEHGRERFAGLL